MKRWTVDGEPDAAVIAAVAEVLARGGVALLPTDTIYGLHAAAGDDTAIARIVALKGRPEDKPFITLAASAAQLRAFGAEVPVELDGLWPAALTAVLRRGTAFIAARVPDLAWLRALIERTGPIVSTSANHSGEPSISSIDELPPDMAAGVDAAVDAGPRTGKPSTIVDFTGPLPRLIREGDPLFAQNLRKTLRISL